MKSLINKRIAEKLTELYTEAKELPCPARWSESPTTFTFIFYTEVTKMFYFGGYRENGLFFYNGGSPIPYKRAIREVWDYIDDDMKTEIMSTVLGGKE